ncbi:E3 ubiquitin-protein ligase [Phytophthora citrophthora]|uniref:E3 ubiquitin-protein ligase n=1 Tax=Phytophthora citrophthora TaxID=4793 RepID=A0AAD9L9U2_9STRA|nr:E3 ubiquitin-protein ligase [Phytophthora citrophthora]
MLSTRTSVFEEKLLASSGLMNEPHFRRLIKFQTRRRESLIGNELEIDTTASQALASQDNSNARFTVYCMHIHRASDTRQGIEDQWVLRKRYSELEAFRRLLFSRIERWEYTVRREFTRKTDKRQRNVEDAYNKHKAFAVVSNAMRRAISPTFPRKHVRSDKPAVIKERVAGLPNFVRKTLGVYTDLAVYKTNSQLQGGGFGSSWAQLSTIFSEIETFLEIPQPAKDAEFQRQSAVLALRDFDVCTSLVNEENHEQLCSICLNEDPVADEVRPVVALPCGHHFHEDCVIDWFSTSPTCPLCRRGLTQD